MDIDNLINNIDSSNLSIAFGRIKNISTTTISATGLEVAVGDIVKIESVQHSSTVLGMVASINSEVFTIVPFSFEHSSINAAEHRLGYNSLMYDPSVTAIQVPLAIESSNQLLSPTRLDYAQINFRQLQFAYLSL